MDERIPLLGSESASVKTHDESGHSARHAKNESRRLVQACALTTVFFFIELVGGYLAGSLAVMSDAAHLLSDLAGFLISLIAVHVARMPASATMSFGFERAAPLGAFVSMLFIWVLTFVLVVCAVRRLLVPAEVNGPFMVVLGVIGLAFNLVLTLVLGHDHGHGHGHSHSHGHAHSHGHGHFHSHSHSHGHDHSDSHSHSPSLAHDDNSHNQNHGHVHNAQLSFTNGHSSHSSHADESPQCGGDTDGDQGCSRGDASGRSFVERILSLFAGSDIASVNLRAAYIHAVGDALQNVGVIVAGIMLVLRPTWTFVDPICTLVFAFVVIWTTAGLARETIDVLMEGAPAGLCLREIFKALSSIDGVERVGDLHVWSISQQRPALSVHLYVSKECVQNSHSRGGSSHELLADAQRLLVDKFSISHATIQINCSEAGCCDGRILAKKLSSGQGCVSPDVLAE